MKKDVTWILIICLLTFVVSCEQRSDEISDHPLSDDLYEGVTFDMPRIAEPSFSNNFVNIVDFGAVPDGSTFNTKAIADAIDEIQKKGGGRVIIPRGIWFTGPITLKSNINLHTEEGALIVFSKNFDDYPLIETSFEGLNTFRCTSPINGRNLENVAITGKGVFDGSGDAWRPVKKSKLTETHWKELVSSGGILNERGDIWYPTENALRGVERSEMNVPDFETLEEHMTIRDFLRPVMVSLVSCKKVLIDGPTFQNSPAWCLHPLMCEDIIVRNVTVKNPWYSQNGDGIDLESCRNAAIYKSSFDVGDDAICIKSGKDKDGRTRGRPTEKAIIKDCIVYHGHGGFTVGSEMSGGVRDIYVSKLTFIGTDVGLRFKSTRGRGGVVENIYISDIKMINIPSEAILFDLYYTGNSPIPEGDEKVSPEQKKKMAALIPEVTEETPSFKNIFIENVRCNGAGRAVLFQGLPEMNVKNINLENVAVTDAKKGLYCIDAERVLMKNVSITVSDGPAMLFYNSKNVVVDGFEYETDGQPVIRVTGEQSSKLEFRNTGLSEKDIDRTEEIARGAVTILQNRE
jgi:polygalacturonase